MYLIKKISTLFICIVFCISGFAQKISYVVSFPNINHHEAQISLSASGITTKSAIFRMSRSSPGRYATHEYGKNVYDLKAFDKAGKQVVVNKIDADVYEVPQHDGFLLIE